jgi:hypothetical protein
MSAGRQAALLRRTLGSGAHECRQPSQIFFFQFEHEAGLIGQHEVEMHAFQQAQLLSIKVQFLATRMQGIDACEQAGMHVDGVAMRRQARRANALYSL